MHQPRHPVQAGSETAAPARLARMPEREERRLWLFALLGPLFLYGLTLLFIFAGGWLLWHASTGGAGHAVAFKAGALLLLVGGGLFWQVLRLRAPAEPHIRLHRKDAPALWRTIDKLARELQTPSIDALQLTAEYNAAAEHRPSWLPFARGEAVVHVGLPLMMVLDDKALRAVLAHEMAHISGRHTRMSLFIWRALAQADIAQDTLQDAGLWGLPFRYFYAWYVPALHRRAMPFARRQEYAADAAAAAIAGPDVMARALCAVEAHAPAWAAVMQEQEKSLERGNLPQQDPFTSFRNRLKEKAHARRAQLWLARALRRKTVNDDTHPALSERLRALGTSPATIAPPSLPERPASEIMLSPNAMPLERALAQEVRKWQEHVADLCRAERKEILKDLEAVRRRLGGHPPGPEDASALVRYLLTLGETRQALAILESLEARLPRGLPPLALAQRGVARLHENDQAGAHDLLTAVVRFPDTAVMAAENIGAWLDGEGAAHDTPELRQDIEQLRALHEKAFEELQRIPPADMLHPPQLTPSERAWIAARLAEHADVIRAAFVAERRLHSVTSWRHLEILVHTRPSFWFWSLNGAEKCQRLAHELAEIFSCLQHHTTRVHVRPFAGDATSARRIRKHGTRLKLPTQG